MSERMDLIAQCRDVAESLFVERRAKIAYSDKPHEICYQGVPLLRLSIEKLRECADYLPKELERERERNRRDDEMREAFRAAYLRIAGVPS